MEKTKFFAMRLSEDLLKKAKIYADKQEMSLAAVVRQLLINKIKGEQ